MSTPATLPKNHKLRVFGALAVGLLAEAGVVTFMDARALDYRDDPLSIIGTFVYLSVLWIVPAVGPGTAVAAWLSIRAMERVPAGRPLWFWAWRAVAAGAPLGAASTALWFALMFHTEPDHLRRHLGPVTAIGAAAGAGACLVVALYCWRCCRIRALRRGPVA